MGSWPPALNRMRDKYAIHYETILHNAIVYYTILYYIMLYYIP